MAIQGLRTTSNFATDERPKNWREGLLRLYPNGSIPLVGLTSMMKKRAVDDPEFNWWEKPVQTRRLELSGASAVTASGTTITVASGALGLKEGDLLYIENTEEQVRVVSDPTVDTAITVSRAWNGSATAVNATTAGVNKFVHVIGSVYEEGSAAPTGVNFDPTKKYNYTQIFRNSLEITRTASKTRLRTGDQVKEAKRECLEIHGVDMERAFWLGARKETVIKGKPARSLGGFKYLLDQYDSGSRVKNAVADHASGVEMQHLEEYLYDIFKYGSNEKMAFCGNRSLLTIQQIVRKNSQFQITAGIKEYGMNVSRLDCPFGTLILKNHPLFNQLTGTNTGTNDYYGMESWMCVMDMTNIQYVHLKDSDTKYEPKQEANGIDGMQSGYLTECSLEIAQPETHYLIKNLTKAKVDA